MERSANIKTMRDDVSHEVCDAKYLGYKEGNKK